MMTTHPTTPASPPATQIVDPLRLDQAFLVAVQQTCGDSGVELVRFLAANGPTTNVDLLEMHPHHSSPSLHRCLYALFQMQVANYRCSTDSKGWITFTWYLTGDGLWRSLRRRVESQLRAARAQLQLQRDNQFFRCARGHRRLCFNDAMARSFQCPRCHGAMLMSDGARVDQLLQANIRHMNVRLTLLDHPWATA